MAGVVVVDPVSSVVAVGKLVARDPLSLARVGTSARHNSRHQAGRTDVELQPLIAYKTHWFLLSAGVCLSVCLSQAGVLPKRIYGRAELFP